MQNAVENVPCSNCIKISNQLQGRVSSDTINIADPNPRGGSQLLYPNELNSILTSAMRKETLTPNECNSTLMSGTRFGIDIDGLHLVGWGGSGLGPLGLWRTNFCSITF